MKKSRFTEPQIIRMLQSQQEGKKVAEICRDYGISEQTFYNWKGKYGGMSLSELQRVKELEAENPVSSALWRTCRFPSIF